MKICTTIIATLAVLFTGSTALAAPELRANITVVSSVVTVGDMFENAGELADKAIFRSPQPGTAGTVGLAAVKAAARSVGLTEFTTGGIQEVRVGRAATIVDEPMLTDLVIGDLRARGLVPDWVIARAHYRGEAPAFTAEAVPEPARLLNLQFSSSDSTFLARFMVAGMDQPVELPGRLELLVEAPHLATTKAAGAILTPQDVEMRLVPLRYAGDNGVTLEQLVGKQLRRQSREGLMLKIADVTEPETVRRNSLVTVVLRSGALTLTVKGQALNSASAGDPVQVLNTVTRKVLHGTATATGTVEMTSNLNVAGL